MAASLSIPFGETCGLKFCCPGSDRLEKFALKLVPIDDQLGSYLSVQEWWRPRTASKTLVLSTPPDFSARVSKIEYETANGPVHIHSTTRARPLATLACGAESGA